MKRFCVNYDLHDAGEEEYDAMDRALTDLRGRRILESTWLLDWGDNVTCSAIIEYLQRFIDIRHDIFVCEIAKDVRTQRYKQSEHRGRQN